jgi:8-oxo-dGTP pyrophosphatase MutT (NUDIX family)
MKCHKQSYDVEQAGGIMLFSRSLERVLLICDKKGVWRFPCGRLKQGESFLESATREFLRETEIPRMAYSVIVCPIPVISSRRQKNSPDKLPVRSRLRLLFPAVVRSSELLRVKPVLGSTSDVAWLSLEEATVATRNPRRVAALTLGHAIAKGIREDVICRAEEIAFESVAGRDVLL